MSSDGKRERKRPFFEGLALLSMYKMSTNDENNMNEISAVGSWVQR
jgi:hypothetical protein